MNTEWIHTSDRLWVKKICDKSFKLVEIRGLEDAYVDGYVVVYGEINLNDTIIEDFTSEYGEATNQAIAECLFEQTSEMELGTLPIAVTLEDAEELAEAYMKEN